MLYRLPQLLAEPQGALIFVVEGEKDADRLAGLGLVATTNAGGAGKWRPDYTKDLTGRRVAIMRTTTRPGRAHAEAVRASLASAGVACAILELDGLPEKGDASDWLDAGGTADRLVELAEAALAGFGQAEGGKQAAEPEKEEWEEEETKEKPEEPPKSPLPQFLSTAEFLAKWRAKNFLLKPIIEEGRFITLTGPTGTGKTAVILTIVLHIALGMMLGPCKVRKAGILFLAGENPDDVRTRWLTMLRRLAIDPSSIDVTFVEGRFDIAAQLEVVAAYLGGAPDGRCRLRHAAELLRRR